MYKYWPFILCHSGIVYILLPNPNSFILLLSNAKHTNDYPFCQTRHVVCEPQHFLPQEIQFLTNRSLMSPDISRRKTIYNHLLSLNVCPNPSQSLIPSLFYLYLVLVLIYLTFLTESSFDFNSNPFNCYLILIYSQNN